MQLMFKMAFHRQQGAKKLELVGPPSSLSQQLISKALSDMKAGRGAKKDPRI